MTNKKIFALIVLFFVSNTIIFAQISDTISDKQLDFIVIQASKSNVQYKDLPASVTLMNNKNIEKNQVETLSDLSASIPNFFMPDYGSKLTSPVYIRGIGSRINSPSVGLYVDDVPYFEKAAFAFDFFDIQQIEVLRGPQGTLFGRNTMGGIINITTISPFDYQGTKIKISGGNFGQYNGNISHYNKFGDKLGVSIAVNYIQNNGFYTNNFNNSKIDKLSSLGARNKLIWEVSDKITLKNIINFEKSSQGGYPYAIFNDSLQIANNINYNQFSGYNRNLFSDAMVFKFSSANFEIISTTSYQFLDDKQEIDQDFTADSLYFVTQEQVQNMISQDILIRSKNNKKYNWLFGAFGFAQFFGKDVNVDVHAANMELFKKYDHSIKGYAVFHQSTFKDFLLKGLSLTAGIRLDYENDILDYKYDINMAGTEINKADTIYPELSYFQVLPKFAVNYSTKNISFYATVAKGYKTGGFNSTFERDEDLTFDPEHSWNYEIGTKMSMFDSKIYTNFALFYIDWINQQIYQTVPSGQGSMLKNAGHSESKGGEFSLTAKPLKNLIISGSYGYTEAKFLSYEVDNETSHTGNYIPYVPRHTVSGNITKVIDLKSFAMLDEIHLNLLYRGNGDIYWNEENTSVQKYYNLLDAKISFKKKIIQVDFWAKNILTENYNSFYFEALGNQYVQIGRPMTFGANLIVKF